MPGLYDLNAALELHPFVTVVGVGNQLGQTAILRRNDTGNTSGVVDASACGFNGCKMGNLTLATASTG
ncbi:hypothetical protein, partial [Leifsonia sp. SIMBA_070]|uniref:hypothetical protein n=1 Tax=Leifsonia sp. SIMBA_070 TaxID=3085810 RepID=UPI00397DC38C